MAKILKYILMIIALSISVIFIVLLISGGQSGQWKTDTIGKHGLTIEYPADWHADTDYDRLHIFKPQPEKGIKSLECITDEIQYGNIYADRLKTIDDYVEEIIIGGQALSTGSEMIDSEWTTVAGHRAFLFTDSLDGTFRDSVTFVIGEDVLSVSCMYKDKNQRQEFLPVFNHMHSSITVSSNAQ